MRKRKLREIAEEIHENWSNIYFGALPYLQAMGNLDSITDMYYQDTAKSIVNYFLSNATGWRGDKAREIKAELKQMLNS